MKKRAFIDAPAIARQYKVGDTVRILTYTSGHPYTGFMGRVTAVLAPIGCVDVETQYGNVRYSAEDIVKDNSIDTSYMVDTSEQTWERTRAKRLAAHYFQSKMAPLIRKASYQRSKGSTEGITYNEFFDKYSTQVSDSTIKSSVDVAYNVLDRTALYWKSTGRVYSPTKEEIESGIFTCPKCKCDLQETHYKMRTKLYACPECLWLIRPRDFLPETEDSECLDSETERDNFFHPNDQMLRMFYGEE